MAEKTDLKSFCINILRENGITDELTNVDIRVPDLQGQHFGSSCDYVTVHRKCSDPIELFVKKIVDHPTYGQSLREVKVFEKEAGFYNEILPEFRRIIKTRLGSDDEYNLNFAPKCYFANEEMTVQENLAPRGYFISDKIQRQDLNQARMVVQQLATFHAPSYILLKEETNRTQLISKHPCLVDAFFNEACAQLFDGWMKSGSGICGELLQANESEDKEENLEIFKLLTVDVIEKFKIYFTPDERDVCHVINHGDFWNNNMMFIEDPETKQVNNVVFVDYQVIRVGSPNLDLGVYLYTSVKNEVRRKEWKNLLKLYYDSLVKNVETLKGNVCFSFEDFLADYKRKFLQGFTINLCVGNMFEILKDIGKLDDIEGDVMTHIQNVTKQWMKNNPQKKEAIAENITGLFKEYRDVLSC